MTLSNLTISVVSSLFLYGLSALSLYLIIHRLFRPILSGTEVIATAATMGPLLVSLLLYFLFLLFPGNASFVYVLIVSVIGGIVLLAFWNENDLRELFSLRHRLNDVFLSAKNKSNWLLTTMALGVVTVNIAILIHSLCFPIVAHDDSIWRTQAKLIFQARGIRGYPSLEADPDSGFYSFASHPPALQMMYVWFHLWEDSYSDGWATRTVGFYFSITLLLLVFALTRRYRTIGAALLGMFTLATIPLFAEQGFSDPMDPLRMAALTLALLWLSINLEWERKPETMKAMSKPLALYVMVGIATGVSMYSHTTGALALPVVLVIYVLVSNYGLRRRAYFAFVIGCVAVIIGGVHYLRNLYLFGTPIGFKIDPLLLDYYERHAWPWTSVFDVVLHSILQPFTRLDKFGVFFYVSFLALIGLLCWKPFLHDVEWVRIKVLILAALIIVVALYIPKHLRYNWRFVYTIAPIGAYFIGAFWGLEMRWERHTQGRFTSEGHQVPKSHLHILMALLQMVIVFSLFAAPTLLGGKVGLRNVVSCFFCDEAQKKKNARAVYDSIEYMNLLAPEDATALVFDGPRYFYSSHRKGIVYYDPRMIPFYRMADNELAWRFLTCQLEINYVLIDSYYETNPAYTETNLLRILTDPAKSQLVHEWRGAKVYRLNADCQ